MEIAEGACTDGEQAALFQSPLTLTDDLVKPALNHHDLSVQEARDTSDKDLLAEAQPLRSRFLSSCSAPASSNLESAVYDVVPDLESGVPALVPTEGLPTPPLPVDEVPGEALVTVRVFRFFEDRADHELPWELELRNVNSGSLHWLPVHMEPGMHSKKGAKYGRWFATHHVQIYAKHLRSPYHMANDGCCLPAKTFGSTTANTSAISGETLERGYFWYVSPSSGDKGSLHEEGWRHIRRAGPFDGSAFARHWRRAGGPMEPGALQAALEHATDHQ